MKKVPIVIMGAAGRDYWNFLVKYKNNPVYKVVAFTATQIPGIAGRNFPATLAGKQYPKGIPILPEEQLETIIAQYNVEQCILAYSDLPYDYVMHLASRVLAAGADFKLQGPMTTMIKSKKPVIAICAVRTGCGKSQTTRAVVKMVKKLGKTPVVIRHPMPYGQLDRQACQIFRTYEDLDKYQATIEEREEYEKHIEEGTLLMAGVDYKRILLAAEKEADVIIWDGGNNDLPFYYPDLHIVIADALRPGHEKEYYPGEVNARMADVVIINKANTAKKKDIQTVKENIKELNPKAKIIIADSTITVTHPNTIKGKNVVVVEDGPTLTHGGMSFGAGVVAAKKYKAKKIVNPKPYAVGSIKEIYKKYKQLSNIIPAMGYSEKQRKELQQTINKVPADAIIIGTPIHLQKILKLKKPAVNVTYELKEKNPQLEKLVQNTLKKAKTKSHLKG